MKITVSLIVSLICLTTLAQQPSTVPNVFSGNGVVAAPWSGVSSVYVTAAFSPGIAQVQFLDVVSDAAAGVNCKFYKWTNSFTITTSVAAGATNLLIPPTSIGFTTSNQTQVAVLRSVRAGVDNYQVLHIKSLTNNTVSISGEPLTIAAAAGDILYQMTPHGGLTLATGTALQISGAGALAYSKPFKPLVIEVVGGTNAAINQICGTFIPLPNRTQ